MRMKPLGTEENRLTCSKQSTGEMGRLGSQPPCESEQDESTSLGCNDADLKLNGSLSSTPLKIMTPRMLFKSSQPTVKQLTAASASLSHRLGNSAYGSEPDLILRDLEVKGFAEVDHEQDSSSSSQCSAGRCGYSDIDMNEG